MQSLTHYVGLIAASVLVYRLASWTYKHFLRPKNSLRKYGSKNGAWAVVTGASGGIGKEFSVELARRGFNVVIISRSEKNLVPVADAIKAIGREVRIIAFDCGTNDVSLYESKLLPQLADLDIGILVNNVGINVAYPEFFHDHTQADIDGMLNTNIQSMHQLTRLLISKLKSRKGSAIIFLSSQSALVSASPMLSVYAATKAYLLAFARALAVEYKRDRIDVLACAPGMTVSDMTKRSRPSRNCPMPSAVVKPTLDALGGPDIVYQPYWFHCVETAMSNILPFSIVSKKILGLHIWANKRAQEKFGSRHKSK